ncbi:hypothetical protein HMPREF9443_00803 [Phascolarctobacterium succinatutens YIT 12067]|uniref:Uncharacterized protein n=1 Tax=Phascolarctobacterium succinatutens YIT 12067 TaxID=626939 RepID=E8LD79_9FIRM|nr:hypothetical protein HMPREF9443_00803 [Phascolarctobacterium succinatutens YIT 12067]
MFLKAALNKLRLCEYRHTEDAVSVFFFLTKILTTCVIYDNISYYIIIIFAGVNFDNKYCRVSG